MSDTENSEPIRQVNTSGSVLHVPALAADVGPGEEVSYPQLLAGFTPADQQAPAVAAKPTPPTAPVAQPAAAPAAVKPAEPNPAEATPATAPVKE